MAFPQIIAQLIADGHHVHAEAMRALLNTKDVEGVCLVSDSINPKVSETFRVYLKTSGTRTLVRNAGQTEVCIPLFG